nr:MAG TPA: hypothetical protein [Caudoviricetes sp.]DAI22797.1 MAG TPA: hypothetical protein [Caudoviricetes sp.]
MRSRRSSVSDEVVDELGRKFRRRGGVKMG